MANFLVWCVWFAAAFACIASALAVVTFRNPFFSALALIGNLAALAVLYLLLGGEFVAAGQVLVYGGAVMVMFLFVIAYLGDRTDEAPWAGGPSWQVVATVLAAGSILVEVIVAVGLSTGGRLTHQAHIGRSFGSPESIGRLFLTNHLIAFEVTSIVLLVAAVGGVVLGSHATTLDEIPGNPGSRPLPHGGSGKPTPLDEIPRDPGSRPLPHGGSGKPTPLHEIPRDEAAMRGGADARA